MIGIKLFDYEITRKIKAGGMGVVYEARRVWGKRERVAVKFLLEQLRDDDNIRRRFIREAEILEMLTHPRIVRILGLDPDRDAFVMEFVEGKTLAEHLRNNPHTYQQPQVAVEMFAKLLDAFDYAHHVVIEIGSRQEQGVIHRDIKPSNIIIEPDGNPKILDFGISRISTFESTLTDPKLQMGSVAYMSPEQIVNPAGVDWRSDIYALGVNLWELFAGRSPYPQVTNFDAVIQVQNSIRNEPLPSLVELHATNNSGQQAFLQRLDGVVALATAKDPTQRYQRCLDMRNALLATLNSAQTTSQNSLPDAVIFTDEAIESLPLYIPLVPETFRPVENNDVEEEALMTESATRMQEVELAGGFTGGDSARMNEAVSITPDGSFRPVHHAAPIGNTRKKPVWLVAAIMGVCIVIGAILWWPRQKPVDPVLGAKSWEISSASDSTMATLLTADSCYEVGLQYFNGENGKPKDYKRAAIWYQKAAGLGNSYGQSALGYMYQNSLGVEQDHEKALRLFQASAAQGNAEGQKNLGYVYNNGLGVPQNFKLALKWYQASANQGNAEGQVNLGTLYDNGEGVEQNKMEAVKWYRRAANQQLPLAEYYLGTMYQFGQGTEQSTNKAIQWYKQAAQHGNEDAEQALRQLRASY
ncbi:serine/threonine-protein kinase [Spirosoma spitsbergense]|uniref:serine/threonine-protein kinase n=1 Tax=Spirosoma spitsbergense TaxID=431554 RepID=UPI00037B2D96|nr:serine/threonine-protein kinase [Spirosoma spitsbergense]